MGKWWLASRKTSVQTGASAGTSAWVQDRARAKIMWQAPTKSLAVQCERGPTLSGHIAYTSDFVFAVWAIYKFSL